MRFVWCQRGWAGGMSSIFIQKHLKRLTKFTYSEQLWQLIWRVASEACEGIWSRKDEIPDGVGRVTIKLLSSLGKLEQHGCAQSYCATGVPQLGTQLATYWFSEWFQKYLFFSKTEVEFRHLSSVTSKVFSTKSMGMIYERRTMKPFLLFMMERNCVLSLHYLFEEHFIKTSNRWTDPWRRRERLCIIQLAGQDTW